MRHSFKSSFTIVAAFLLCGSAWAQGVDPSDPPPVPLGDVARSMRKGPDLPAPKAVIDNDNFDKMMEAAETHHGGSTMLFSFDSEGKTFKVSPSPDVTCSLSFNAQATALISDPYVSREMPAEEIAKLSGPATIQGDHLQVAVLNGTTWRLDEIVVGLTIVHRASSTAGYYESAKLVPAASETVELSQKAPDSTTLYKMRAAAPPAVVTVFQTGLSSPVGPDEEWHWAIVQAKGIPPQPGAETAPAPASSQP